MCHLFLLIVSVVLARACVTPNTFYLYFIFSVSLKGWVQLVSVLFCYFLVLAPLVFLPFFGLFNLFCINCKKLYLFLIGCFHCYTIVNKANQVCYSSRLSLCCSTAVDLRKLKQWLSLLCLLFSIPKPQGGVTLVLWSWFTYDFQNLK